MSDKPPDVLCPDWSPREPGKKRCAYYQPPTEGQSGATCSLGKYFLCVEWVRANEALVPAGTLARLIPATSPVSPAPPAPAPRPQDAPKVADPPYAQGALFGPPEPLPEAAPAPVAAPPPFRPPNMLRPAKEIPEGDIAALEALASEIELVTAHPNMPQRIFLVAKRSAPPVDRFEITYREAATLRLCLDAFPGGRIVAFRPPTNKEPQS